MAASKLLVTSHEKMSKIVAGGLDRDGDEKNNIWSPRSLLFVSRAEYEEKQNLEHPRG